MQEHGDNYAGYGQYGTQFGAPPPGYPYGAAPPPPPRGPGFLRYVAVAVAAAALGAGAVVGIDHIGTTSTAAQSPSSSSPATQAPVQQPSQPAQVPSAGNGGNQSVVSKVSAGLVIINTALQYRSEQAAGTGIVLSSSGLVLTNNHVVENSTSISATIVATGKTYPAKVLGYDQTGDIAAIQLQGASGLKTAPLGSSSGIKVGDNVVAMGNAQGGSQIVPASGQITALHQTITANDETGVDSSETLHNMIQTNAAIISGDSGGALATMSGQVVGMNTAGNNVQYSQQGSTGFAIPINDALSVVNQITAGHGSATISLGYPPFMGIFLATSDSSNPQTQAQQQAQNQGGGGLGFGGQPQSCYTSDSNLPVPTTIAPVSSGALVVGTICNGPAQSSGMSAGAVITAVNGQAVGTPNQLHNAIANHKPGESVSITWVSTSGHRSTSSIKLIDGPPA